MSGVGPKSAPTYNIPAPTNYVAGIGRGAMGFTTRSDIGPARVAPTIDFGAPPEGYVAGRGRGMGELARTQGEVNGPPPDQDRGDYSESNYDEFSGYSERLFASGTYDEDDVEADRIYNSIDDMMDNRRKRSREKQLLEQQKKSKSERPRIADQFADLKRELATVTAEQWDAIPEVGDHSLKLKQSRKKEGFTPVPDSLITSASALRQGEFGRIAGDDPMSGTRSVISSGLKSGIGGLAEVRGTELQSKLDKISDSVSGQTVVDPKGYITSLNSIKVTSEAEIGDIKKARVLLQSVTSTNPKHGPGWIAAARVEEYASKMQQARKVILQGCEQCPESEDVWIEAARLHPIETAKAILANAVIHIPTSVKIWLKAADLETQENRKKAVLRRALEFVPNSVQLWKAAIELENVTDARIMLARAVECVPQSVEMWLALAKLETHENARKVLNQAREAIPTERATWITAAKLEEAHNNGHLVARIIEKMVVSLAQYQVVIKRDEWIQEAVEAERSGAVLTCRAIIRNTIHLGVELEDRKKTWMDDAETCLATFTPPAIETSRAIIDYALEIFPTKKTLWLQAAMLEKEYGTADRLEARLKEGVKHCPQAEILWLMAAKEKWLSGNVPGARAILLEAFNANPKSEQIWLAAVKLEWENQEFVRAKMLLTRAREKAPSERVWLKSALFEREQQDTTEALRLLDEGISKYPQFAKYYMMAGQICDEELNDGGRAEKYYLQGLKACVTSIPLWQLLIRLKERRNGLLKARSIGEMARIKLPKNDEIWLECIRLERRSKDPKDHKLAETHLAKALQDCPNSSLLWSEVLLTCAKPQRRSKAMEALKRCDNSDPLVIMTTARLFEQAGRIRKAKKWFERSLTLNPKLGDTYIYYFAMEYVIAYKLLLLEEGVSRELVRKPNDGEPGGGEEQFTMEGIDEEEEEGEDDKEKEKAVNSSSNEVMETAGKVDTDAEATLHQLLKRITEAQPNQGEAWCSISKQTSHRRKEPYKILIIAVEQTLQLPLKYFQPHEKY